MAVGNAAAGRRWLAREGRGVARLHALAVGAGVGHGLAVIVQAGLIAWVAAAVVAGEGPALAPAGAALIAVVALRSGLLWLWQWAGGLAGRRVCERLRRRLLNRVADLGPGGLTDLHSAGIASRVVEQADALEGYYARFRPQLAVAMAVPLAILATVAALDWLAALLLLAAAPLIPVFMALVGMGAERLNRRQFRALSHLAGHFLDRVRGLPTLQLFGHAEASVADVAAASDAYRQRSLRTLRVAFVSSAVLEFFASVAIATVAIYVGLALLGYIAFGPAGGMTLSAGLFILLLAPEFFQPLRTLSQHYHDRATALGAAAELDTLLARAPAVVRTVDSGLPPGAVRLEATAVTDPERGALAGPLTLAVDPGESVVLWGASGSGKSTLLRLVAGLQAPSQGRVRVGGRGAAAWLGQRPFLMRGTIADNIRLGAPGEVSDAAVRAAAEAARVTAFTDRFPHGLDTAVGERGRGLSGGQAQRVALARVFLSDAAVVVLDEPTAALDAASEAAVIAALGRLRAAGRTLIIASHHEPVRAFAARVIRLADGTGDAAGEALNA